MDAICRFSLQKRSDHVQHRLSGIFPPRAKMDKIRPWGKWSGISESRKSRRLMLKGAPTTAVALDSTQCILVMEYDMLDPK
jgi:hypothetical protein